ncbi:MULTISPECIES: carboxypeptidase regulatory-like domain-containing protein [Psychrilyobacter]|uniref:Type II secretion system protein GspD n=1 Tax=Psychrilyobacter piezotolerans TaxID=2293438 RepID=A0ABX9KGK2_9FUSO|nr:MULTISPECIES: carboxypeptidase regulatory-like domain-containing protein [Psychrilyobacter]MCS5420337.1 carboxypeptidase regulatory-like domain-containing protein [Psychrilyobacter sp. S5]NDI78081.1 type II secretion system protein GspD [Psychrilyobacter piezotolerans]RDE61672.1 type II secretion system protein GspD [Psychrilyobacter sp. S5]REI41064.1 type II secretion system protein GspD [Psychrilyobacter piezotolerans]
MKKYIFMLLIIFTVGAATFGATIKKLPQSRFEEDMDFNGARLSDALALMSKVTGVTMVADSEVKDVVIDLYINKGQPLREVLDIIKVTNGLEEIYVGEVIMLAKTGKGATSLMGKIVGDSNQGLPGVRVTLVDSGYKSIRTEAGGVFIYDNIRPGVYILKLEKNGYATSSEVVDIRQNKITNIDVILDKKNKEGLVVAKKEEGLREKELGSSKNIDGIEVITERIQLKHGFAEDIKGVVDSILGETLTVTAFPKLHMLVLKGGKDDIDTAKKLIDDLDRSVKQVRITAQVLETSDDLLEDLGFDWLFSNKDKDVNDPTNPGKEGTGVGLLSAAGTAGSVATAGSTIDFLDIFNDGKNLLDLSINLLQTTSDLSISSVPSVVIVNGELADFKVTEEVIVGTKVEVDDDGNRTEEPIWEEAGTIFSVTPIIREGLDEPDTIILEVSSEVSDFELTSGYSGDSGGKQQSNISTKVQIQDGDVIFIGGLKKVNVSETVNKVPILGDIPLLGTLFRSTTTKNDITQVYIQLTAEIVTDKNANSEIELSKFKENPATTGKLNRIYPNFERTKEEGIDL